MPFAKLPTTRAVMAYRPPWPKLRQAIQTTVAAVTAYVVATAFSLPQGYWAVMTAILVVQANLGASLGLALDRLLATLLGAIVGVLMVTAFGTSQAVIVPQLVVSVGMLAYIATYRASLRLAPVTAAIVILGDIHYGSPLSSAINRVLEIGVGAIIAVAVSLTLFPSRAGPALSQHVGRTLQLFAEHLRGTFDVTLGATRTTADFLALNAKVRANLAASEAMVTEARREIAGHVADHADPAAVLRTLRRLWYTQMMATRAARMPLPTEALAIMRPSLEQLRDTTSIAILRLASAYRDGTAVPNLADTDDALAAMDQSVAELRQSGITRAMATEDLARIFALDFALSQLGQNLRDLADRHTDLRGQVPGKSGTPEIV